MTSAPPPCSTSGRSAGSALPPRATPPRLTRPSKRSPPLPPACSAHWKCVRLLYVRGADNVGHEAHPQPDLADPVRVVDGAPVRASGDHLLHPVLPDHYDPLRH